MIHGLIPDDRFKCTILVSILWWAMGIAAFMENQGLDFYEAVHMLGQQVTTIGYGSNTPQTDEMKIFHAFHGFVAQMDIFRQFKDAWAVFMDHIPISNSLLKESLSAGFMTIATTAIFAGDFHQNDKVLYPHWYSALLDAFYTTVISMTTIGYGDFSFTHNMTKLFSPFILAAGVTSLERWYEAVMDRGGTRERQYPRFCRCFTVELKDF